MLNENNFIIYAANGYRGLIQDEEEFYEDLNRIKYIKKMLFSYNAKGDINLNLIINHIIILYNLFEDETILNMLFYKLSDYTSELKTILYFMNRLPEKVIINGVEVDSNEIPFDKEVYKKLKEIINVK